MYSDPIIVFDPNTNSRAYIKVHINGKRHRFYNGKAIGIACFPNNAATIAEKKRLLQQLHYTLKKKLEGGWLPSVEQSVSQPSQITTIAAIEEVLRHTTTEEISDRYRTDMVRIGNGFIDYLRSNKLHRLRLGELNAQHIEAFLQQYTSSGTYYMTQRSNLAGIFTRLVAKGHIPTNLVYKTARKRKVPLLNAVFTKNQFREVLASIAKEHKGLHLCALLMYGCFLRPHREVRLLQRRHLNSDCSQITLSGNENKSKRIRVVQLPEYVTQALLAQGLHSLQPSQYLFTKTNRQPGPDYFKTIWSRVKRKLIKSGLLERQHTLYSFRHTGAVEVYLKTKDPYRVQRVMFHSTLAVTLVYLRSLGLLMDNDLNDLPEL